MSTRVPNESECIGLMEDAGCRRRVIIHCRTVNAVAEEMVSRISGADRDLVRAGALLHDLGRARDHSVMHAYVGSRMAEDKGLPPELVSIIRKHTGAGLDAIDVREMGLPPGDYMPMTLEEKIVAHADNLVSDDRVVSHMHSVEKLMVKGAVRGAERVESLHAELSQLYGEDLDVIKDRIGEFPISGSDPI